MRRCYEEAKALVHFPLKDTLEGIEMDIRLTRELNVSTPPRQNAKALSTANVPYMVIGDQAVLFNGGRTAMTLWITSKLITLTASYREVRGRPHSF